MSKRAHNFVDISGKKFGKLTVIKLAYVKNQTTYWECKCDCDLNKTRIVQKYLLTSGKIYSCGCSKLKKIRQNSIDKMIGKKFNHLTVIEYSHSRRNKMYWKCMCDCGNPEFVVTYTGSLTTGNTKSCGCVRSGLYTDDISGQKFNMLTVIEYVKTENKRAIFKCLCDCGNYINVMAKNLRNNNTKSCGCLNKTYASFNDELVKYGYETRRDPNKKAYVQIKCHYCNRWFTPSNHQIHNRLKAIYGETRGSSHIYCGTACRESCPTHGQISYPKDYKNKDSGSSREVQPQLRKMVLERDNWECQQCGKSKQTNKNLTLHCHHIDPVANNPIESADIDNCITLCKSCHKKAHQKDGCGYSDLRNDRC